MKTKCVIVILIAFCLISFTESFGQVFKKLNKAYTDKIISADEMILNKVYYMFAPSKVNKNYIDNVSEKIKCGTLIIREYIKLKSSLSKSTQSIIDSYLTVKSADYSYISAGRHFKLSYSTTGANAVPTADNNGNGVPDYVEWIAGYLETAWNVEVTQCGFLGPYDTKGDGYYNVSFESVSFYGLTLATGVDGNEGTRIVLHNSFIGFPANQDPEGTQKGAAKVTCAHEFKHASQCLYSPEGSEGDFVELDATWAEELAFDYVNDSMLHYTGEGYGDPFSMPNLSLDAGANFYGKYFWEDFLHQKFDHNSYTSAPIILAFWQRRASNQSENVLNTYDNVLRQFGSSLSEAFTEYTVWNYYTKSRAIPGFGYDEAGITGFPEAVLKGTQNSYPVSGSGSLDHLACDYIRLNPGGKSAVKTTFNGYDNCTMNAVVTWTNGSTVTWGKIPLNSYNDGSLVTATKNFGALIPVITIPSGIIYNYNYTITNASFSIAFTNKSGTTNLGGSFALDGNVNDPISSGSSRSLLEYSNHNVRTNNERFTSSNNKHHDWNGAPGEYKLPHDFQVQQGQNQNALFQPMNAVTVRNYAESSIEVGGSINFHDPWYVDQNGNQPNNILPFSSPYYPKGKYGESNGGVFLKQGGIPPNLTPPYYNVCAILTQDIYLSQTGQTHKFYFQSWNATPTSAASFQQVVANPSGYDQKAVVFNSSGAAVNANYKGTHLSNTATAFSNNSQRKLVRTKDGRLHQVYESAGRVWLEHSTNDGVTWTLGNNGKPLDNGAGKCPSIDWHYNSADPNNVNYNAVVVAFQQQSGSTYTIQYAIFKYTNGSYVRQGQDFPGPLYTEPAGGDQYAVTSANPNIAWGKNYYFALTFERKSTSGSMQPGIYWIYGFMYESGVQPSPSFPNLPKCTNPILISGTTSSSINTAISLNKLSTSYSNFDIVYQQGTSSVKDVQFSCTQNGVSWNPVQLSSTVISSATGVLNYKPSMVQMPDCNVRVCWIRSLNGDPVNSPFSVNVVYWNSAAPSQYSIYGWSTRSVSLNVRDDNARTFYAFSQYSSSNQWENYISNGSSYVKLSTTGNDVQLSNGPLSGSNSNMYTSSYYNSTLPYYFKNAGAIGSQLSKASFNQISCGRGAVLGKDDFQFSYSLKNLTVDNNNIKFVAIPEAPAYKIPDSLRTDTVKAIKAMRKWEKENQRFSKLDTLNTVLLSEPFAINDKSNMILSEQSGFLDTIVAVNSLGDNGYVAYKLELVDNGTNKTIATIKESKFTSTNLSSCNLSSYNLNVSKVGTRTVRVRITLNTNIDGLQGALVDEYGTIDVGALAKSTVNEITLQGSEVIKEYALEQNYPNPFNPSTTIHYQIPNAGYVTLKVYDMLGREVAALVDGVKEIGSYTTTFNGEKLASGVYISRLIAGDYTKTMKMVLMK